MLQCKFCDKQGNITVVPGRDKPFTLEDSESSKFVAIGCFDCRGIEPVEFSFRDGWAAEGVSVPQSHINACLQLQKLRLIRKMIRFFLGEWCMDCLACVP